MRLLYLSTISLLFLILSALSGGDFTLEELSGCRQEAEQEGLHSYGDEEPELRSKKLSDDKDDVESLSEEMHENLANVIELESLTSPTAERLGVLRVSKEEFNKLDENKKRELTKDLSAENWNELLEKFWAAGEDEENEKNISILYYALQHDEERRLEMLKEALNNDLKYLFMGMSDLVYVPDTPRVTPLLEQELEA